MGSLLFGQFDEKKSKKGLKKLREACKYRDMLYRMDQRKWKKAAKMFEKVAEKLDKAGDKFFADSARSHAKTCRRRAEIS